MGDPFSINFEMVNIFESLESMGEIHKIVPTARPIRIGINK
jgi:hypothetical protein